MLASFLAGLRAKFSNVEHLPTAKLDSSIESGKASEKLTSSGEIYKFIEETTKSSETEEKLNLYLLDVRSKEEYGVSHLPMAINTPPEITDHKLKSMIQEIARGFSTTHYVFMFN